MLKDFFYEFLSKWGSDALYIVAGVVVNLEYTIFAVLGGVILGILLAISKISKNIYLRFLANFYTSIFRGTPIIIQLSIFYFVLPSLFELKITPFVAGVSALAFNSAAYVSEVIRAGIVDIDKGQYEASYVLGISKSHTFIDIILPQAIRKIFPSLANELINMFKETAIISVIGEIDIFRRATLVSIENYNYLVPMFIAACSYYFIVLFMTYTSSYIERKIAI